MRQSKGSEQRGVASILTVVSRALHGVTTSVHAEFNHTTCPLEEVFLCYFLKKGTQEI